MIEYLDLLDRVLTNGTPRHGEKPEGTLTVFGEQVKFNFTDGFPLITCRDMTGSWNKIIVPEILWMISGSTSAIEAQEKFGLKLWNKWAEDSAKKLGTPPGELGPIYGKQLRNWNGKTDQVKEVIEMLKRTPETRRAVISLWNLEDVEIGGLKRVNVANCISMLHLSRMNYKLPDGGYEPRLDMIMTQRSADLAAGSPHDWANWALLQMMVAKEIGLKPGTLTASIEDGQIYDFQIEHVKELLKREPLKRATVTIDDSPSGTIFDHTQSDFHLENYRSHPKMIIPVAI
ncbi:thymidylate synthase [soil metagenome]